MCIGTWSQTGYFCCCSQAESIALLHHFTSYRALPFDLHRAPSKFTPTMYIAAVVAGAPAPGLCCIHTLQRSFLRCCLRCCLRRGSTLPHSQDSLSRDTCSAPRQHGTSATAGPLLRLLIENEYEHPKQGFESSHAWT